jgi:alkaline phosphatase
MKFRLLYILISLTCLQSSGQIRIHAHNDYQKPEPLINALRYKVFSIEADIYLSDNRLLVAHDKKELATAKTLDSLYLQPIIELFHQYKGTISEDTSYAPILMIDIKENGEATIAQLIKLVSTHRFCFRPFGKCPGGAACYQWGSWNFFNMDFLPILYFL